MAFELSDDDLNLLALNERYSEYISSLFHVYTADKESKEITPSLRQEIETAKQNYKFYFEHIQHYSNPSENKELFAFILDIPPKQISQSNKDLEYKIKKKVIAAKQAFADKYKGYAPEFIDAQLYPLQVYLEAAEKYFKKENSDISITKTMFSQVIPTVSELKDSLDILQILNQIFQDPQKIPYKALKEEDYKEIQTIVKKLKELQKHSQPYHLIDKNDLEILEKHLKSLQLAVVKTKPINDNDGMRFQFLNQQLEKLDQAINELRMQQPIALSRPFQKK